MSSMIKVKHTQSIARTLGMLALPGLAVPPSWAANRGFDVSKRDSALLLCCVACHDSMQPFVLTSMPLPTNMACHARGEATNMWSVRGAQQRVACRHRCCTSSSKPSTMQQ